MIINRAKYCSYCQCPKSVWLKKNKNEEFVVDKSVSDRASSSNEICELECKLFGKVVDVTAVAGGTDPEILVAKTKELIEKGVKVISKAAVEYDGAYAVIDILKKEKSGYSMYRTKSSTSPNHHSYIVEVSYNKYILQKCGIDVVGTYVINVNTKYHHKRRLHLNQLFKITSVEELVADEIVRVEDNIKGLKEILDMESEPDIDLNTGCHSPFDCGFWKYCSKHLPSPSVFDLYATSIQKKVDYYRKGIVTFEDIREKCDKLDHMQKLQIEHGIETKETYIDQARVREFLDKLWYPLYFLDFETVQMGIPKYKKSRPYQPTPFQYSLHYIENPGDEPKHKEFLASPEKDPRKQVAMRLASDIPETACVLAYNQYFERDRIKDLAKLYPTLSKKLFAVAKNVRDLIDPFAEGMVYNRAMGNSTSIKSVLPALYPFDPSLDYSNLDGVQNGNDAMSIFPKLLSMTKEERKEAEKDLLEYCKLDTFAMVKIYEWLVSATKEK